MTNSPPTDAQAISRPSSNRSSVMMKNKKPVPDEDIEPKLRHCLACRSPFTSAWAGERICPKCKSSSTWRSGTAG